MRDNTLGKGEQLRLIWLGLLKKFREEHPGPNQFCVDQSVWIDAWKIYQGAVDWELAGEVINSLLQENLARAVQNDSESVAIQITDKGLKYLRQAEVQLQKQNFTDSSQASSILIIAVTKVEIQAVLNAFTPGQPLKRKQVGSKTYYDLGIHGGAPIFMVQSEMGIAAPGGALLTVKQAIDDLQPQAIIMCGIAYGLRPHKQKMGDILVSKQLAYYEPQKIDQEKGQIPRGDRAMASERLLDRFRSADLEWTGAAVHFGLMLSGEKLVNDPAFRDQLLKTEPEAIGGEMEGAGLYAAARAAKVDWMLVKAICDWADGTKVDDAQPTAAANAALFVLHVLQIGGWGGIETNVIPNKQPNPQVQTPKTGANSALKLTPAERRELEEALLDAFPNYSALERMVFHQLNVNLEAITGRADLQTVVFQLVQWAEATGQTRALIEGARRENPGNAKLAASAHKVGLE